MGKNIPDFGKLGEALFSKIFPQLPKDYEDRYNDIPDYSGFCPECPKCGTTMGYSYLKTEFKCPDCGYIMDEGDWDYDSTVDGDKPWGCEVCGGPWPDCQISCSMFDD